VVPTLLEEYGAHARRALCHYLDVRGDRGAEYLAGALRDYPERGGRSMRATLCIVVARAFGAKLEDALDSAAALEMLHNAFLVHDDIEDDSEVRRGRPALHVLHGVPIAINVGDALSILSLQPLLRNKSRLGARLALGIFEETERMARETVEGQAIELGWRQSNATNLTEDDYLRMVLKKTCWYTTIFPIRVGALIGARSGLDPEQFIRFGFFVGAAFQIQDDLLNLIGDEKKYGKELTGDLWEGKRTLMLVHTLAHATPSERSRIRSFLARARNKKTESEVKWVLDAIFRYGSIEYARAVAHGLAGAAETELQSSFTELRPSRDLEFLRALPAWVISRA
jgi:geranylgeranyl diphosphate synthase type II